MALDLSSADGIMKTVAGRSDEDLLAEVAASGGVASVLDTMFEDMRSSFVPGAVAAPRVVINHEITHADGVEVYSLIVDGGTCDVVKNGGEAAKTTIAVGFLDYLRLATKELNPMIAMSTQRFKITGDMSVIMQMGKWFPEAS